MHAQDFSGGRDLEALLRAPVRLQFLFRFHRIAWHCSRILSVRTESSCIETLRRYALCCAGALLRGAAPVPFFGASSATRTFPSIRGGVSICPCSPISPSKRVIFA